MCIRYFPILLSWDHMAAVINGMRSGVSVLNGSQILDTTISAKEVNIVLFLKVESTVVHF